MRTTLTLDADVARLLDEEVHRARKPFKHVVNDAIRRGLASKPTGRSVAPYRVEPHRTRLLPGIDPVRLNALADELEAEAFVLRVADSRAPRAHGASSRSKRSSK